MTPEQAALFAPGDLDEETGLFAVVGRTGAPTPAGPTMTTAEVRDWLGISGNDMKQAVARQSIRRVSNGRYLTSSVVRHLPARGVCNLAQTCAVLRRSPSWLRANLTRVGLELDVVGATYRFSRVSVNRVATQLRRVDDSRNDRRVTAMVHRSLNTTTDTDTTDASR